MAYMNQERKAKIAKNLKPILAKFGVKASLAVRNHMTIVLNVKSGPIDFVENLIETDKKTNYGEKMSEDQVNYLRKNSVVDVNPYWYHEHFSGTAKKFLTEAMSALKSAEWYDESNPQIDHFNTAYYIDIKIGNWKNPYTTV
jgi:hypothetical protein